MKEYLNFASKLAERVGKKLLFGFDNLSVSDRDSSISTKYDKLSDKMIKKGITDNFPDHSILSEESGLINKDSDYLWIIDPIDGTGNFVNHNPFFSISIALWYKGEPVVGVIEAPYLKERYLAIRGGGAIVMNLKRKRKIRAKVSKVKSLADSYLLFCGGHASNRERTGQLVANYYSQTQSMRKIGSAAIELGWVGCGRAEVFITPRVKIWDIAAGVLFVKEAGGKILDFNLDNYSFSDMLENSLIDLVATNGRINLGEQIEY